ncbi:HYC_CC_PP family protein [Mangrovibacterium diazotrophicum]|uniref:Uncharacterized protein n=1 Tax=Mangrovibacterium diazotrophicum TaxID=1261403 RepID=A0A419VX07_9BACT|nr:hypothetical protein [Mangrovibacterium diazotrophicum]RKD86532.1 hypothetical protein BC643_4230 [Mangrovibacterium diazotrophicum]
MIRKISHITIVFLLLVLTMGFTVSKHYCGETLVDVSVVTGNASGCSDDDSSCDMGSCCHNENHVYQLQEDYTSPLVLDHVTFFPIELATLSLELLHESHLSEENTEISYDESPPPKLVSELLSDIQVYRL